MTSKYINYDMLHYGSDCGNIMTTFIWPEVQIGLTYEFIEYYQLGPPHCSHPQSIIYITPDIKGINNDNRSAYKIIEIHSEAPNVRFAPNSPFWSIMKKDRYYQYCSTFVKFIIWLQSAKQKIYPETSFVEALYNNSLVYDKLLTKLEKQQAKLIFQELDGIYHQIFWNQNKLNEQVIEIYTKLKTKMIYCHDDIKRKIRMKQLMNKYFKNNISKHGIIYQSLHLTYFEKFKLVFNVIEIDEFRNIMNSWEYIECILQCLDVPFGGVRVVSEIVMEYCKEYFLLPLEKS